jgi:hypothetical protein
VEVEEDKLGDDMPGVEESPVYPSRSRIKINYKN